jgi:hypothetical protein
MRVAAVQLEPAIGDVALVRFDLAHMFAQGLRRDAQTTSNDVWLHHRLELARASA